MSLFTIVLNKTVVGPEAGVLAPLVDRRELELLCNLAKIGVGS